MNPTYDFSDSVAFVTGASSGMGLASAQAFAEAGAAVTLTDVNAVALRSCSVIITGSREAKSRAVAVS